MMLDQLASITGIHSLNNEGRAAGSKTRQNGATRLEGPTAPLDIGLSKNAARPFLGPSWTIQSSWLGLPREGGSTASALWPNGAP